VKELLLKIKTLEYSRQLERKGGFMDGKKALEKSEEFWTEFELFNTYYY